MIFGVAALVVLSATPDSATLVSRRVDVDASFARSVADLVSDELLRSGLAPGLPTEESTKTLTAAGVKDSATCEGRTACLAGLGRQLDVRTVVGVDVGRVVDQYAVTLEAVDVQGEARLARRSFLVKVAGWPSGAHAELKAFATDVKSALAARPPPAEVPRATAPAVIEPPPIVTVAPAPVRWPRITLLVAAGATAIAAVGLGIGGFLERDSLRASEFESPWGPATRLTQDQANAIAARSNSFLTASLICGIVSAVLAAAGFTVWAFE